MDTEIFEWIILAELYHTELQQVGLSTVDYNIIMTVAH